MSNVMMLVKIVWMLIVLATSVKAAVAVCYFPAEYQGIFATQATLSGGSAHKYSQITILPDGIPVWGVCHSKNGSEVILHDSTGGQHCFRCFHVTLHLPNVIQIHTEGLDKCYTHENAALATCPTEQDIKMHRAREIMLYKSRSFARNGLIDKVFCPFSGNYFFTYDVNDGTEESVECPNSSSTLSTCPKSSELQLRFSGCKFSDTDMKLQCLGDWTGVNGFKYFALWDTSVISEDQPQYRCAIYYKDKNTGKIYISFSIDATCTNHLHSPWDGYEKMVITPATRRPLPAVAHSHACTFPQWARGIWKDIQIGGREMRWKDAGSDSVFELLCLAERSHVGEKYALLRTDQCGDERFTCLWIKQRDINVMEFKVAATHKGSFNDSDLCSDEEFIGQNWMTQGRTTFSEETGCPVTGEYTGVIPDAQELCAKLSSDCSNPQMMHYTVSACKNQSEIYEEREYQCLGQWEEAGIMYTFTYRIDVDTYECFAGVMVNENEVFIIEAGVNCQRGLQPLSKGMKLLRQATCEDVDDDTSRRVPVLSAEAEVHRNLPTQPSWWPSTSSKRPWLKKTSSSTPPPWRTYTSEEEHNNAINWVIPSPFLLIICSLFPFR